MTDHTNPGRIESVNVTTATEVQIGCGVCPNRLKLSTAGLTGMFACAILAGTGIPYQATERAGTEVNGVQDLQVYATVGASADTEPTIDRCDDTCEKVGLITVGETAVTTAWRNAGVTEITKIA